MAFRNGRIQLQRFLCVSAREGDSFSNDLDGYQPTAETVAWASEKYALDASDQERINAFRDRGRRRPDR